MPGSVNTGKDKISEWISMLKPRTVLDVGCGLGGYSMMFRKKGQKWIGIEVYAPYIEEYALYNKYESIINKDLRYVRYEKIASDLVIMGDVVEHIPKEDFLSILPSIQANNRNIIFSIPLGLWEQELDEEHPDNKAEKHVATYELEELLGILKPYEYKVLDDPYGKIGVFLWRKGH